MTAQPLHIKLREKRNRPPDGPWIWLTRDFLESDAWRTAPINTRRVVERIMLEHMAHAGTMNGRLIVTYNDFEKFGIRRHALANAIADAKARGLIIVTQPGRRSAGTGRWPARYALGWLPGHDGSAAPNRWKAWCPPIAGNINSSNEIDTRERTAKTLGKLGSLVTESTLASSDGIDTGKPRKSAKALVTESTPGKMNLA